MNLSIFKRRSASVVGLDISPSSVKAIELVDLGKGALRIDRFGVFPLLSGVFEPDGRLSNPEALIEVIKLGMQRVGFKTRDVVIGMPSEAVMRKVESFGADTAPETLEEDVKTRITESVAYSIDDAAYDFQPDGEPDLVNNTQSYLLVAVPLERMVERIAAVEAAGLKVVLVDTSELAIQAGFDAVLQASGSETVDRNVVLIDIGSLQTSMLLVRNQELMAARDFPLGGYLLREEIQNAFEKPPEVADRIIRGEDPEPETYRDAVLVPFIEQCASEVQRVLQVFAASLAEGSINDIYVTGGCALLDGMVAGLSNRLNVPVRIADPSEIVQAHDSVRAEDLQRAGPALLTAFGLALRKVTA